MLVGPGHLSRRLKNPYFSFCGGNTARRVVSGLSQGLQAKSGFSELGAIPFTKQHVAKGQEGIPSSSRNNS